MDPPEIEREVEAMSEYQAKLVLSLMAAFEMPYEDAKKKANGLYDQVFKRERREGK